ncbi:Protein RTA1 [Paramyrothecium foliicola]|nr:Protein RTA1 [Paramyrothecium foliicola]
MAVQTRELLPYRDDFYLWSYVPNMVAAIVFLIIFLGLSLLHSWKMWRHRMWFCIPFVVGGYLEVLGFIGRVLANKSTDQLGPYIIQSVFLLVPPSLFAASIYMTLGRIMRALGPEGEACSIIKVKWLTTTFVVGDVFAFLVQASGAGYMAAGSDAKMGEWIVVGGLVIQILFFGLFVAASIIFDRRYSFCESSKTLIDSSFPWNKMLRMLYATSALILARSVFRIIEYIMGADAYLLKNEWTLYVFDSVLMAATMLIFFVYYPSQIKEYVGSPGGESDLPARTFESTKQSA